MAWTEAQDQEFGARMQQIAMQLAAQKQQFSLYPYLPQEQNSREKAAQQFTQEAQNNWQQYQHTGDHIYAQQSILYSTAAAAMDPNTKQPALESKDFKNIDLTSSKAPSDKTIAQCLGNVAAKVTSVILGVGLGMMTALTVQAAVAVTATILFGPVIGIGSNVPGVVIAGAAGIKAGIEGEKVINKKIKSTTEWLKNCVEEAHKVGTGKDQTQAKGR